MMRLLKSILTGLVITSLLYSNIVRAASHPTIMVSIKPFYNIAAYIMQGIGKPELLLHNNASPHDYQLKPSDAQLLENASLVIWGGPELESYLQKSIANLPANRSLNLATARGLILLPLRTDTNWETHSHNHDDHDHNHSHLYDPHFWLDPDNAIAIAQAIAVKLSELDPGHDATYRKNSKAFAKEVRSKKTQWQQGLKSMHGKAFIVFHDAYQYFDSYFNLDGVGSITLNPEIPPSAQRIQQIQTLLRDKKVTCIFSEPQFNPKIITTLKTDNKIYEGVLDPLGQEQDLGPQGYFVMMDHLVNSFESCGANTQ